MPAQLTAEVRIPKTHIRYSYVVTGTADWAGVQVPFKGPIITENYDLTNTQGHIGALTSHIEEDIEINVSGQVLEALVKGAGQKGLSVESIESSGITPDLQDLKIEILSVSQVRGKAPAKSRTQISQDGRRTRRRSSARSNPQSQARTNRTRRRLRR